MRRTLALAAIAALPLTAIACGGDDDDTSSDGGNGASSETPAGAVTVIAEDSLDFDQDSYSAPAGEVTFIYENGGSLPHTLLIEGIDDFKLEVGDTDEGAVELEAGDYTLYCDVPGHQSAGMEASLTVE
jgi:cytochrome c oxidase subunit 2